MRLFDITLPLREAMPVYPGDPSFTKRLVRSRARGDACEVSRLTLSSHAGTHVDVPHHFIEGGADLSAVPLEPFVGPCRVLEATGRGCVDAAAVAACSPLPGERVLFKTDNSARLGASEFMENYVYLAEDAAGILAAAGVVLVGWDYLSVERYGADDPAAHRALLGAGVLILEGLNLAEVPPGEYFLMAAPLAVDEGDGAPARALLAEGIHVP
jgi:arylformamidase